MVTEAIMDIIIIATVIITIIIHNNKTVSRK